jgi:hypothetical protein
MIVKYKWKCYSIILQKNSQFVALGKEGRGSQELQMQMDGAGMPCVGEKKYSKGCAPQ